MDQSVKRRTIGDCTPYADQFGNKFRYRSVILDKAGAAHDATYDVFLQFAIPRR